MIRLAKSEQLKKDIHFKKTLFKYEIKNTSISKGGIFHKNKEVISSYLIYLLK